MALKGKGGTPEKAAHFSDVVHRHFKEPVTPVLQEMSEPGELGVDEQRVGVEVQQVGLQNGSLVNVDLEDVRESVR